jgi:molecular chaperone DnaK
MIKEAEAHAEEDKKRREEAEARNSAEVSSSTDREVPRRQRGDKVSGRRHRPRC